MKNCEAVIFDLWGTLVDELTHPEANRRVYRRKTNEMADLLGLERDQFAREWSSASGARIVGTWTTEAVLLQICKRLGVEPRESHIRACVEARYEYTRDAFDPRAGTVETISILRDSGYRIGLISNCFEEVSLLWSSTPFSRLVDSAILSFELGLAKPDIRIYEISAERLGVSPQNCLYVGDGSDGELSGASQAGMTAVLMRAPYDLEDGNREAWEGKRIANIREVLDLL